jgi:hypothetical protein
MSQNVADMMQECQHNMSQLADTIRELEGAERKKTLGGDVFPANKI